MAKFNTRCHEASPTIAATVEPRSPTKHLLVYHFYRVAIKVRSKLFDTYYTGLEADKW